MPLAPHRGAGPCPQRGRAPRDVENITKIFHETVKKMTESKQRTSPGAWNNLARGINRATFGILFQPYQGCIDQATTVNSALVNKKFDDNWDFEIDGGGFFHFEPHMSFELPHHMFDGVLEFPTFPQFNALPHHWLKGTSSNPKDPIIIMDPYNNVIRKFRRK